jgi:hypothetical protein
MLSFRVSNVAVDADVLDVTIQRSHFLPVDVVQNSVHLGTSRSMRNFGFSYSFVDNF